MAIDRAKARQRVRTITGWSAAGAAALTAAFAFGAARGSHVARATSSGSASTTTGTQDALPQSVGPSSADSQTPQDSQGFTPPSASTGPPAGMSGGS